MKIQLHNTLTNQLEEFQPIVPGKVTMYSCGPTVYDFAHIGNFRTFLFGDLLRRFLELVGYDVHHVTNITDVGHMTNDDNADGGGEDRMQVGGQRIKEAKKAGTVAEGEVADPNDPFQVADYYMDAFLADGKQLGYKVAFEYPENVPRATDNIDGMIKMIQTLLDRGHAYIADDGVVYFSVESFARYGRLSNNTLNDLQEGASERLSQKDQQMKKHPADFMLWKADENHIMKWPSPWGTGYPGWHIECSVMARDFLGADTIDIHTGGEDLIFPHHECEIAQSCCSTGAEHFARYWVHARFLMVEGEKMSKSAGTFYTVRDVLTGNFKKDEDELWGRAVDPAVLRFELLKSKYSTNLNFTAKSIGDSATTVRRMQEFRSSLEQQSGGIAEDVDLSHPIVNEFATALADDLNIAGALAVINPWIASKPNDAAEALGALKLINSVLNVAPLNEGLDYQSESAGGDDKLAQAEQLCKNLDAARAEKNYDQADAIREQIRELGFEVRTTKEGTVIQKELV